MTIAGQDTYSTKVGGAATILVMLAVFIQSAVVFNDQVMHPDYN